MKKALGDGIAPTIAFTHTLLDAMLLEHKR